jgi:hypothetical protein
LDVYGRDIDHGSPWQFRRSGGAALFAAAAVRSSCCATGVSRCVAACKTETKKAASR